MDVEKKNQKLRAKAAMKALIAMDKLVTEAKKGLTRLDNFQTQSGKAKVIDYSKFDSKPR